ncbi:MAG: helix-turn-helix transcriptional regulator [Clostridia bacterium]|nr:helix-turn-helix transcriptional regulator [Clostridia bacterium]
MELLFYHTFTAKEQFELKKGSRPWFILMVVAGGSFRCTMQGATFIAEAGDAVCFPPHAAFEREMLNPLHFHQMGFYLPVEDPFSALLPAGKLQLSREQVLEVAGMLDRAACGRLHDSSAFYAHTVSWLLTEHFLHACPEAQEIAAADEDITQAVQYLTDHLEEKINMGALADRLHLSYTGFLWKFRRAMQCTPSEYLIRIRMQYAKQLLLEGEYRINEIAALCGYSSAYYFSNAFHKYCGISPGTYRKKYLK